MQNWRKKVHKCKGCGTATSYNDKTVCDKCDYYKQLEEHKGKTTKIEILHRK